MQKSKRNIKVNAASEYQYKEVPTIKLKGDYLDQYGFSINTKVEVKLSDGKIVITKSKNKEKSLIKQSLMRDFFCM